MWRLSHSRWALLAAVSRSRPDVIVTAMMPGHAVKQRRGRNVARVALARRLAELVYHVW
jgi:hypothetical protein